MAQFTLKLSSFLLDKAAANLRTNQAPLIVFDKDSVSWKNRWYSFDGYMKGRDSVDLQQQVLSSVSQLVFLGFNSSLMLSGLDCVLAQTSMLQDIVGRLYQHMEAEKSRGALRLSVTIEIECYEIFADNQIRDLIATDATEKPSPRMRESELGVHTVEGLTRVVCVDVTAASQIIQNALQQQTVLVALPIPALVVVPNSHEEKQLTPKIVGPAAHIFMLLHITQHLYVAGTSSIIKLHSTLQITSFASAETLSYHSTPTEAITFMTQQKFDDYAFHTTRITSKLRDLKQQHFGSQDVKKTLQQNSFKALSTFTRVVQILGAKFQSFASLPKGSKSIGGIKLELKSLDPASRNADTKHIPFRDSLLTRIMQSPLSGNYAQFSITIVNSDDASNHDAILSALRFSSGLHKLCNFISSTKSHVRFEAFGEYLQATQFAYTLQAFKEQDLVAAFHNNDGSAVQVLKDLLAKQTENEKTFPVKTFSDFERAIEDIRNDLNEIAVFCSKMNEFMTPSELAAQAVAPQVFRDRGCFPQLQRSTSPRALRKLSIPTLGESYSSDSYQRQRSSHIDVQIQQIQPTQSVDSIGRAFLNRLNGRNPPPKTRTSLSELSEYLVGNGATDYNEIAILPELPKTGRIPMSSRSRASARGERRVFQPNIASVDVEEVDALSAAETDQHAKIVQSRRRKSIEEDAMGLKEESEKDFFRTISSGLLDGIEMAISRGVSIHVKNSFGRDAMQIAARNGSLTLLKRLIDYGGNIHTTGPDGESLFFIAGRNGHLNVLMWLLETGSDPLATNDLGQTLAHVAARRGELLVLHFLHFICHDNFNTQDHDGKTPLQSVPRHGPENVSEVKKFLNMVTSPPETRDLFTFALQSDMDALRRLLIQSGLTSKYTDLATR